MQRSDLETLAQAIGATAEAMDTRLQPMSLTMMAEDLLGYSLDEVLVALKKCRMEKDGRLTSKKIVDCINEADGFIGADEAWVLASRGEGDTVVITQEIAEAMQIARPLLNEGDSTGARMNFRDAYSRIVSEARRKRIKPKWFVSLGHDRLGRAQPVADAIRSGKIGIDHAISLMGPDEKAEVLQLTGNHNHPFLLVYKQAKLEEKQPLDTKTGLKHISELKRMLTVKETT